MKAKKFFSLLLVLVICLNSVSMTAMAAESEPHTKANVARATGRFSMDVPGGALVKASSSFPLEAGETVTIKATYTPFSTSVDFGLIAPDGYFYYLNADSMPTTEALMRQSKLTNVETILLRCRIIRPRQSACPDM